jgi:glycerophosphoryl diester phosphodiesterase
VDVLSVEKCLVDEGFMAKARDAGKQVHVWTVNETVAMRRLMDLGADAVITNYPDRFPGPQEGKS